MPSCLGGYSSMEMDQSEHPKEEISKKTEAKSHDVTSGNDMSMPDDVKCGYGSCKPAWLQKFNNPKCQLIFLSWYAMTLGFVVNGINNVNTTSIERRFNLPSAQVGFISSAYDISAAILGVIVSFLASGKHKARWLASCAVVMAIGSFVMSLPHFTTGLYELGEKSQSICKSNSSVGGNWSECGENEDTHLHKYLYVFILGQVLHGVGGTAIYTVGISLIDDGVPPSSTPLYIGILYGFSVLGPGLGYLIGGQFLNIYVDVDKVENPKNLTPHDPRWVGAWWIGFLMAAVLNFCVALPLFAYGKELPVAETVRQSRVSQAHGGYKAQSSDNQSGCAELVKKFCRGLLVLLRNPCFVFITLGMVTEGMVISGSATFLPKFIENEFRISAAMAAIFSGVAVVPSAAGGQFLGGFIARKLKLDIRGTTRLCLIGMFTSLLGATLLWINCTKESIAGINAAYPTRPDSVIGGGLNVGCNSNCHCTTNVYEPVCDTTGLVYFSPCHAGCQAEDSNGQHYLNCTCVGGWTNATRSATVTSEGCRGSCVLFYVFLFLVFCDMCVVFLPVAPGDSIQLRCVPEEFKTFAQGVKLLVVRLVGTVPGPVIFGKLLDMACVLWREKCGQRLSCWIYDNHLMSRNLFIIFICCKILSIIFTFLALRLYRPPSEENEEQPEDAMGNNSICSPEAFTGTRSSEVQTTAL